MKTTVDSRSCAGFFASPTIGCGRETDWPSEIPTATTEEIPSTTPTDVSIVALTAVPLSMPTEVKGEVSDWVLAARQSTQDYLRPGHNSCGTSQR